MTDPWGATAGACTCTWDERGERIWCTKCFRVTTGAQPGGHWEYRAVFSYPSSILGQTRDSYSEAVKDPDRLPKHPPRAEETHGWRSGTQKRFVTEWSADA